ncbi:MAG: FapA family protein [Muribaculaceae bacterium]|nr:FapA family protein [Muribaculaceae bacterium]MCM1398986.1 FapA family protein [Clostridium sp.]MCM1458844.1 FapA family protein [Bacteroides sp.]
MENDWVVLKIDDERMIVSLTVQQPEGAEQSCPPDGFIEGYLKEHGVTAGLDKEAIAMLYQPENYGQDIVVAKGKEPVNGRDGFFEYTMALEDDRAKPVVKEDGSVDYVNSLKLAMINKGDLFAVYIPPTPGEYGYTVCAEMLPPVKGKDLRKLRGKGFYVNEEGTEYRAALDGRIRRNDDQIIIESVYEVRGDLDIQQGNIKFNGDVEVKGDVRSGLTIETDGNIYIHGHVGGCRLIAGGTITIRKGIQGKNKCTMVSKGDVACSFMERCIVSTGGDLYANYILDSDVAVRGKIYANSRQGIIIGGNVSAMQGIIVKEVGNTLGTATTLQSGVSQDHVRDAIIYEDQLKKLSKDIELLDRNLKKFDAIPGNMRTKENEELRMRILRAKVIVSTDYKKLESMLDALKEEMETARQQAVIKITGYAYNGTKIVMGQDIFPLMDDVRDVEFRYEDNKVVQAAGVYRSGDY